MVALNEYKSAKIFFPATFLEVTTEYTITLSFSSYYGVYNYNYTKITTLYNEGPDIQFDDSVSYTRKLFERNTIKVFV